MFIAGPAACAASDVTPFCDMLRAAMPREDIRSCSVPKLSELCGELCVLAPELRGEKEPESEPECGEAEPADLRGVRNGMRSQPQTPCESRQKTASSGEPSVGAQSIGVRARDRLKRNASGLNKRGCRDHRNG